MVKLPPAHLSIGPAIMPDFMSSIQFYCLLAWPTLDETAEFHRVVGELIAGQLRTSRRCQSDVVQEMMTQWPQWDWARFLELSRSKRRLSEGRLRARLKQRMIAAHMAIGVLHDKLDVQVRVPEGWTEVSLDKMAWLVRDEAGISDPENVEKLIWRPSLPIIHIAIATQLQIHEFFPGESLSNISYDDAGFVRDVIERAVEVEPILAAHPLFIPTEDERAGVHWFECVCRKSTLPIASNS